MNKEEAIKWVVATKEISPFTRNFVEWLYDNYGMIFPPIDRHGALKKIREYFGQFDEIIIRWKDKRTRKWAIYK